MASMSARGPPVNDSEEAEILACRKAMEFAIDARGLHRVDRGRGQRCGHASSHVFRSKQVTSWPYYPRYSMVGSRS